MFQGVMGKISTKVQQKFDKNHRRFSGGMVALFIFSAFTTLWGLAKAQRSEYYASIAMSMSKSFSNFFFGAIDPAGTVTLDKIPGSYWLPAIFVKIFGFSTWAIEAPNAIATVALVMLTALTIKNIYGASAGLIAGAVVATTPILLAVSRSNQPQAFFLLTLGFAALYAVKALDAQSRKYLVIAGAFIALAFHTYMLEAWALWPALIVAWFFTHQTLRRKILDLLIAGSLSLALSLVWILTVWLIPSSHRPYVGGTYHNNPFEMVFGYNGLGRFSATTSALSSSTDNSNFRSFTPPFGGSAGVGRLFNPQVAGQIAWLIPTALVSAIILILLRTKRSITIFHSLWLLTFFAMFSAVAGIHQFYTSSLALPVAALIAGAVVTSYQAEKKALLECILITAGISSVIIGSKYSKYLTAIPKIQFAVGLLAVVILFLNLRALKVWILPIAISIGLILTPAAWSFDVKNHSNSINPVAGDGSAAMGSMGGNPRGRQGAMGNLPGNFPGNLPGNFPGMGAIGGLPPVGGNFTPPQGGFGGGKPPSGFGGFPGAGSGFGSGGFGEERNTALIAYLKENRGAAKYLLVTYGAQSAAPFITTTGENVLPIGGFDGEDPTPTLAQFKKMVQVGEIRYVLGSNQGGRGGFGGAAAPTSGTSMQISNWVKANCPVDPKAPGSTTIYVCNR